MSETIAIEHSYTATAHDHVELPDGVTFAAIRNWYVKWCEFHFTLDGVTWQTVPMYSDVEVNDTKHPTAVSIYPITAHGDADYSKPYVEGL